MSTGAVVALVIALAAVVVVFVAVVGSQAGRSRGYSGMGGKTIVRCSQGHLFTTTWIAGTSFMAFRLGLLTRYQRCPVCKHWAVVHPIKDEDLTDEDRRIAGEARGKRTS